MNINLPADQEAFIGRLLASGQFHSVDDVISEGVRLLVSRERLKEQIQIGLDQADRGEVADHDTVFAQLRTMVTATPSVQGG